MPARVIRRARDAWLRDAVLEAEVLQVGRFRCLQRVGVLVEGRQVSHGP